MTRSASRLLLTVVAALPAVCAAHVPDDAALAPRSLAGLEVTLALVLLAYAVGLVRVASRARDRGIAARGVAFLCGWAMLAVALLSPLDDWSARSFAAHMVQHEMLMLLAAPLLVLSHPLPVLLWSLPLSMRRAVAAGAHGAGLVTLWRWLNLGLVGWLLHAAALWLWHAPALFQAALRGRTLHELQHATFLLTALVFWSALLATRGSGRKGAAALYLFTTTVHTAALGALITFANAPWYTPPLRAEAPLDALADQQLGGLIMWVPGSIVYVAIGLTLLLHWVRESEPPPVADRPSS